MSETPSNDIREKKIQNAPESPDSFNLKEVNNSLFQLAAIELAKETSTDITPRYAVKYKGNTIGYISENFGTNFTENQAIKKILALPKKDSINPSHTATLEKRIQEIAGSELASAWEGSIKQIPGLDVNGTEKEFIITSDGSMKIVAQENGGDKMPDKGNGIKLTNVVQLEVIRATSGSSYTIKTIDQDGNRCYVTCQRTDGISETRGQ